MGVRNLIGIKLFWIVLLALTAQGVTAQRSAQVNGYFGADSTAIGQIVPFTLTARYPKTQQVLFPDSTFSFAPFEIIRKTFFPTRTTGDASYDSAVYYLTTFEIDSTQVLKLPVFVLQEKDCLAVFTRPDSLRIQYRVAVVPDSVSTDKLPLKSNTAYQSVKWIFNYPMFALAVAVLVISLIAGWMIFGKRIRKYFLIRKLNRNYREFMDHFSRLMEKLGSEFSSGKAEDALVMWKKYMEELEEFPYTKSTSREILKRIADSRLDVALRSIDRGIYGGFASSVEPFRLLLSFSQQQFLKREEDVKNG